MKIDSQKNQILTALQTGAKVTPHMALLKWGCFRLAARIADLKRAGHDIHAELIYPDG